MNISESEVSDSDISMREIMQTGLFGSIFGTNIIIDKFIILEDTEIAWCDEWDWE